MTEKILASDLFPQSLLMLDDSFDSSIHSRRDLLTSYTLDSICGLMIASHFSSEQSMISTLMFHTAFDNGVRFLSH